MFPKVTLVLGGASSGKSAFAERLVLSADKPAVYLATAQADDDEMADRIARHRKRRGAAWRTLEVPLEVAATLQGLAADEVVLLDCATLWLSNHLLKGRDIESEQEALLSALKSCACSVVVVSNEVGQGVVPDNALARRFSEAQGRLNQHIAAHADLVVSVIAGLPIELKRALPGNTP